MEMLLRMVAFSPSRGIWLLGQALGFVQFLMKTF